MKLNKEQVASVVTEASAKMSDPNYSAVLVGGFVQSQTPVAQFISAHERELGGAESIVQVIFTARSSRKRFSAPAQGQDAVVRGSRRGGAGRTADPARKGATPASRIH